MLSIALIGYGKMGKAIEEIALQRGHSIVLKISNHNPEDFTIENLQKADVAIEFSSPEVAKSNILKCSSAGIPVVCGTTGWLIHLQEVEKNIIDSNGAFLYASNFSVGVNIFFELNKKLAALMKSHKDYQVQIEEIHHTEKKDAPSGTAITLAEQIIQNSSYKTWNIQDEQSDESLPIFSKRIDKVPGTHRVTYSSAIDEIEIVHTAHNRQGFAMGAVLAAEYLKGKTGIFSMRDVLDLKNE